MLCSEKKPQGGHSARKPTGGQNYFLGGKILSQIYFQGSFRCKVFFQGHSIFHVFLQELKYFSGLLNKILFKIMTFWGLCPLDPHIKYTQIKHGHCLLIHGKSVFLGTYWTSHGSGESNMKQKNTDEPCIKMKLKGSDHVLYLSHLKMHFWYMARLCFLATYWTRRYRGSSNMCQKH